MKIVLKGYQQRFIYSQSRHPALVASWATGKTLSAILRSRLYSKGIPENLGVIFRKTERSLFDSTLKDFERYTGLKIDSHRNLAEPNGSITMFRHIDEIDDINKQNINLGWFFIEQGDELESNREFFMLFGRLRRSLTPTEEFIKLGLPLRSGWVIANAGDHWMKPLWKEGELEKAAKDVEGFSGQFTELIEATFEDNKENIPEDTIASWRILEKTKPEIYKRFVLNDWSVSNERLLFIPSANLENLKGVVFVAPKIKRIISIDPSQGGDEFVIQAIENGKVIDQLILHTKDTMKNTGEIMLFSAKHKIDDIAIDAIGIGAGIADRLLELGKRVRSINSADKKGVDEKFFNLKSEMWWYVSELIARSELPYPKDPELRRQLSGVRYKVVNSNGQIQCEAKEITRKRLGCSPDRADAFIQGIYNLQYIQEHEEKRDSYDEVEPSGSFMAV